MVRLARGDKRGFTLIELLIAVAIGAVLFSGGLAAYRGMGERQSLKQGGRIFQSNLRLFQQKALAGEKPTDCELVIFEGFEVSFANKTSYSARPVCGGAMPTGKTYSLPEEVEFGDVPETIFFPVLRSELTGAQTITLGIGGFYYDVEIESTGVIRGKMREIL